MGSAYGVDQHDLILNLILGIVGFCPIPLCVGVVRMAKNRIIRIFSSEERNEAIEMTRMEIKARRRRSWGLGVGAILSVALAKFCRDKDTGFMW